jgi:tRNA(Ile)-lysidine synthase TilS/MesJ
LGETAARGGSSYDVLVAYSGGKDSSHTLKVLRRDFGSRVIALTFDHGFLSPRAMENIRAVTASLGVDRMAFVPDPSLRRSFVNAMRLPLLLAQGAGASAICNNCMNLAKSFVLRTAIEKGISLIAYGWSPGQAPVQSSVMGVNAAMVRRTRAVLMEQLRVLMGDGMMSFLLDERHFNALAEREGDGGLHLVHPLAFLGYDEEGAVRAIRDLGWVPPDDTDANCTNCLLNGLANRVHLEQFGYHPYAFEIAGPVRQGHMSREAGLAKLSEPRILR